MCGQTDGVSIHLLKLIYSKLVDDCINCDAIQIAKPIKFITRGFWGEEDIC